MGSRTRPPVNSARELSPRTRAHERHLLNRHLDALKARRIQGITASDVASILGGMKVKYSPWTCIAVYRILAGTFALAVRRGIVTRSPVDGLAPSERPKQRNKRRVAVLDSEAIDKLVAAGSSERWQAALGLACFAGLRLGEIRGLRWEDVDRKAGTITVRRSLLPDGTAKAPKTEAGARTVPLLPGLRRLLVAWEVKSPHTRPGDYVIATADAGPVRSGTSVAPSTPRRPPSASTRPRSGSPGTRSATRSPPCSPPTSNYRSRRSRG
jgi:integrase